MSEEQNKNDDEENEKDIGLTPEEQLKSNKLLLELMTHVYDEDERRNELVDTKNSQMIVLTGAMITLQSTLLSQVLANTIFLNSEINVGFYCKLTLSILFLLSTIGYFISMYKFIKAYSFVEDYQMAPDSKSIVETIDCNALESDIALDMLDAYDISIENNDSIIDKKIEYGSKGFLFLKMSVFLTLVFLGLFILVLFSYPLNV